MELDLTLTTENASVFQGAFVRYPEAGKVDVSSQDGLVVVVDGKIVAIADVGENEWDAVSALACRVPKSSWKTLAPTEVLIPGFVDAHVHAPQFTFAGTGLDLPLLDWLKTYTFPHESEFSDVEYAKRVYDQVVKRTLSAGTTTASYFGTIHTEGTLELVNACESNGQRAHVGKVCMDTNSPDYYVEKSAKASASATKEFIAAAEARRNKTDLVTPSVIPRFAPSCSSELLSMLGDISTSCRQKNGRPLPVHTHLSENKAECEWVSSLFPDAQCYVDVYKQAGLLHESTYFAHCCYCNNTERTMVANASSSVVHCPTSNFMVARALCDVRQWLDDGVTVGLGTDAAGGWSTSILDAMRHAVVTSRIVAEKDAAPRKALSWREVLYLATKGGADALGLETGSLAPGNHFDALIVDAAVPGGPVDVFTKPKGKLGSSSEYLEKFFWNGDDRNIRDVYVAGRRVAGSRKIARPLLLQPFLSKTFFAAAVSLFTISAMIISNRR